MHYDNAGSKKILWAAVSLNRSAIIYHIRKFFKPESELNHINNLNVFDIHFNNRPLIHEQRHPMNSSDQNKPPALTARKHDSSKKAILRPVKSHNKTKRVTPAEYEENLNKMVELCRDEGIKTLFLPISVPEIYLNRMINV